MSTLILDKSSLELRSDGYSLAIYDGDVLLQSVPVKLLERMIIQGDLTLSARLLTQLCEAGVSTLLLSKRHAKRVAIVLGAAHNNVSVRIGQAQMVADCVWCQLWSYRLVLGKIRGQRRLLALARERRADQRKPLTDAIGTLDKILQSLSESAPGTIDLPRLLGWEGGAARAYFSGYSALFADGLFFSGRNRRPPKDPVNSALSLGYTLLHFDAVRACHQAGLDPLLGFYHRPSYGRESLASDIIEPVRSYVDRWVWQLFRERRLRAEYFAYDHDACLLSKAGRAIFYPEYEQIARALRRYLRRSALLLARRVQRYGEALVLPEVDDAVYLD